MKSRRFILSTTALMVLLMGGTVFAQDGVPPPPSENEAEAITKPSKHSRESYQPVEDTGAQKMTGQQRAAEMGTMIEPASTAAFRTFTSGAGPTLFRYTISTHGNIVRLESPAGFEHMAAGVAGEGYIVSMNTSIGVVRYYDAGFAESTGCSGNIRAWSSTVVETGLNAGGTTLRRSTCDGAWQLTQTFARNPINHELTVTMTLKNTSGFNYTSVRLDRYFDGDLDGDLGDDVYTRTFDAVAGQDGTIDNLSLTAITFNIAHGTAIHSFGGWDASVTNQASLASPTGKGDFVGRVSYSLGTMNANTQKIVRVLYKRQ